MITIIKLRFGPTWQDLHHEIRFSGPIYRFGLGKIPSESTLDNGDYCSLYGALQLRSWDSEMASLTNSSTAKAFAEFPPPVSSSKKFPYAISLPPRRRSPGHRATRIYASVSAVPTKPDDLVEKIVSKVSLLHIAKNEDV